MMLSRMAIKRPIATAMILMIVVVIGISSFTNMPQDLLPEIELPVAIVVVPYANVGPEEIESLITIPLEEVLISVDYLDSLWSITTQGQSVIMVQFLMDTNMDFATLNILERISLVSDLLPDDAGEPMVMRMNMHALPFMSVHISSDMPQSQLFRNVESNILPYFERTRGVATATLGGGLTEKVAIEFNFQTLLGLHISLPQIAQILAAENINLPGGHVASGNTEVLVRTIGEFNSIEDLRLLPFPLLDGSIVRLQDIAHISRQYRTPTSLSRIDGETSVSISITRQSDVSIADVSAAIHDVIADMQHRFPEYSIRVGTDQAEYINQAVSALSRAAIIGGLLAMLVIFLFLRSFKATLIIAISIPTSLLATLALMEFRGITLNLITLSALALAAGILIDNSIIVLENIYRTKQTVDDAYEAAVLGTKEIFLAILAATLTTATVFLPVMTVSGLTSLMFFGFSFTVIVALLVSLIISLTAIPMLCSKLLSRGMPKNFFVIGSRRFNYKFINAFSHFFERIATNYETLIKNALKKRKRVIVCCVLIFVISVSLLNFVGTELLPTADEGTFQVGVDMPFGTPFHEVDAFMTEIEEYILAIPEVRRVVLQIGAGFAGIFGTDMGIFDGVGVGNTAVVHATLVPMSERTRSTNEIVAQVNERIRNKVGANISVTSTSSINMMLGNVDMQVLLKGSDFQTLESIGNELIRRLTVIPEISHTHLRTNEGHPEVRIKIDRNIAAHYGINSFHLANGINSALTGMTATHLRLDGDEFDVVLTLPDNYQASISNMMQIMVVGTAGVPVSVESIASLEFGNSPSAIERTNQQRYMMLNIDIDSHDLRGTAAQVTSILDSFPFPDGYFYMTFGLQEEMMDAFDGLLQAFIVAILLAYLILAAKFESLLLPFIVTTSIPFAMSGAFLAMFITGTALSMTSFLGLIVLVGIVTNNAILIVTFITQYKHEMGQNEAIVAAGKIRLRPILMTTTSTCIAMIPISLGIGEGTEIMAPMGISIIGGLIASTLVTLIFVPVIYSIIDDYNAKRLLKKQAHARRIAELEAKWLEEDMPVLEIKIIEVPTPMPAPMPESVQAVDPVLVMQPTRAQVVNTELEQIPQKIDLVTTPSQEGIPASTLIHGLPGKFEFSGNFDVYVKTANGQVSKPKKFKLGIKSKNASLKRIFKKCKIQSALLGTERSFLIVENKRILFVNGLPNNEVVIGNTKIAQNKVFTLGHGENITIYDADGSFVISPKFLYKPHK